MVTFFFYIYTVSILYSIKDITSDNSNKIYMCINIVCKKQNKNKDNWHATAQIK